jgi:NAD(P)-dependent dehydrogenase (short-subunit alcohol dehydrogenase family)
MPNSNQPRRTLLLTGASRGIGHATVKRFSAAGWRVITCSRHPFPENCPWEAGPEDHIQVDLSDPVNTEEAIMETKRRLHGELHALVNNAAISPKAAGGKRLGSIETSREDWHHIFQVNFFAPIMLARGLLDELSAAKGSVVNVTSIAGSRVHPFAGTAYSTSKAALAACESTPLRPARSTPPCSRPGRKRLSRISRCTDLAHPTKWQRSSTCCARTPPHTSTAPRSISTAASTSNSYKF